jgi:hypothetical protein
MPTGNFDEPLSAPPAPPPAPRRKFRLPSDYYCAPLSEVRPVVPKWAPYGCGIAAAVFLVLLFAAGTLLSGERFGGLLDFVIGTSLGELRSMMATSITAEDKERFENEVKEMREGLRAGKVPVARAQPFLRSMQIAIADQNVTKKELEELTKAAHEAGKPVPKKP